jgi:hypothetical protein
MDPEIKVYDRSTLIRLRDSPLSHLKPKHLPELRCVRISPLRDDNLPTRLRYFNNPNSSNAIQNEINMIFEPFWDLDAKHPNFEEIVVSPGKICTFSITLSITSSVIRPRTKRNVNCMLKKSNTN